MSKFSLVVDSSQISSFLECPQLWTNYYQKKLEPAHFQPQDEAMDMGTYGHKLLDIYYRARFRGLSLNQATELCNAYNPDIDICDCGCGHEFHCPTQIAGIEECKRCKKCIKFRPHPLPLTQPVRQAVLKRFREYCYKYQQDDFQPLSEQHVEIGFSEVIYEDS